MMNGKTRKEDDDVWGVPQEGECCEVVSSEAG